MRKNIYVLITIFLGSLCSYAQRHEIGIQVGTSNLVGDIGKTNYINPKPNSLSNIADEGIPFYAAFMYRMNFNPYQSVRFRFAYNHVQFNDAYAQELYRRNRYLNGGNSVYEISAIFDYNFFPVNEEQKSLLSPYIFGGLSGIVFTAPQITLYNDFNRVPISGVAKAPESSTDFTTSVTTKSTTSKFSLAIPFGVGLKYKFNYNWAVFGEFMFRPTISDAIDYSNYDKSSIKLAYNKDILEAPNSYRSLLQTGEYLVEVKKRADDYAKNSAIGNTNSKDWVNTISLGVSYSFGRPPCYCD